MADQAIILLIQQLQQQIQNQHEEIQSLSTNLETTQVDV